MADEKTIETTAEESSSSFNLVQQLRVLNAGFYDLQELFYVSSAGLRVLLMARKQMDGRGEMLLLHVNEDVKEILEMTGFANILTIKEDSQEK